jgi:S-(hydroxymethyl)glutathione dehydrogenase/alcohol dehydrogenase
MKAAVFHAAHQPLTIEDVEITKPKRREVLLRTAYAGLCHSDLHFMEGLYPYPTPAVLGHEGAAVVEAVGEDVTYVKPGDHVITCLSVFCGECEQCTTGHTVLCDNPEVKLLPGAARRLKWKGEVLNQAFNLSCFAEQMLVHEHAIVKINSEIPLDRAALVGCGVMTGVGAVFNTAKVEAGATVAVLGCGGIGLSAINGAAIAGAERIIAIDTNSSKLDIAKQMGATHTINASNVDPVAAVKDLTEGKGVPYSFEAIGLKATAEQSFQMLRPGGVATIIGMIPFGTKIELHGADFLRERKIQGSSMGSNHFRVDMPRLLELWRQGRLKLDHLISGQIKLAEINEGFAKLKSGAPVRNLINFGAA